MNKGKLEFKISGKDANGEEIKLDNLSIHSVKALKIFLESIIHIVEAIPDHQDVRFKIVTGSAVLIAEGPETKMAIAETDFNEVIERSSKKKEVIDSWKDVRALILNNGLDFEVNFYKDNTKRILTDKIREKKLLGIKKPKRESDTKIALIKGNLSKSGGEEDPQLVLTINGLSSVVHCDKDTVRKVDPYKYKEVLLSTWCKITPDKRPHYTYCDIYIHETDFNEFKEFAGKLYTLSESEEFGFLHDKFKTYFEAEDFPKAKKLIRLFNHPSTSVSTLKTLLVVTKAFKDQTDIKEIRASVKELLEKKIGRKLV